MLSGSWQNRKNSYDFVVVGSGYGGAITAARIAAALNQPHAVCILERGKEWNIGDFPDTLPQIIQNTRSDLNALGLYEFLNYKDISVIKGSGLGGTSLINANVAIVPDPEVFRLVGWPGAIHYDDMLGYYDRASAVLAARPVPGALDLAKVRALDKRARQIGSSAAALNVAVNFDIDGKNAYGVEQRPCVSCGDCISGCNFAAKNTLYMNYLPLAAKHGADIFTQTKVDWIEKLPTGKGWRIHGKYYRNGLQHDPFSIEARNVVLSAGSLNSTEILLRSEMRGLRVSPSLGTGFSGNGDFFGLAYNGEFETDVLGYGRRTRAPNEAAFPGPSIVGIVRYNGGAPVSQRISVEDLSLPSAYAQAAKTVFAAVRGDDTRVGDEEEQRRRILVDLDRAAQYPRDGALNHTMVYLVMGQDNARGTMNFNAPWFEPEGRMSIEWDNVGQQLVFTRINEELRRHARALSATFISNPTWNVFQTRHLITAHPLGGCPMGEDYLHGAVDQFGRVFSGDGSVHEGLFVADGSIIPSALGVNPFLTISALTERIAERKIREMNGDPYPKPPISVSMSAIDPLDVIDRAESELEKIFRRCVTLPIEKILNQAGPPQPDLATHTIRNNAYWKGFFPKGHILNTMSSAIFTGFKKEFHKRGNQYVGLTSDTDDRIKAHNSLEEITMDRQTGTLEPGKYILLRYLDPQWAAFYDILKVINEDLIVGRVYLGAYPNGIRVFTFSMTRKYSFAHMTVVDHNMLFAAGSPPSKEDLDGVWQMDVVSNNNTLSSAAYLAFELKPDGRLESRYQLMGLIEGLVMPSFTQDHFQLNDFTPFHDEIRKVDNNLMIGKYVTGILPDLSSLFNGPNLGILHSIPGSREFGFYYTLSRTGRKSLATSTLLQPFLDIHLPDGLGLTFDEKMVGSYFDGASTSPPGRDADLTIADRANGVGCSFQVRMTARDLNEFIDGFAHEAGMKGTITFDRFQGADNVTYTVDEQASRFHYLIVNSATGAAEMRYHLEFRTAQGAAYILEGRKYMQRTGAGGVNAIRELLLNYTTLYCHFYRRDGASLTETGVGILKFRTFEDLAAVGNLADFLGSFTVTGTDDPILQLQGQMRFLAFTAQFAQREYDPLSPDIGRMALDVRAEVLRGAETPDYFSTRATADLHAILRDTTTLPIEKLLNTGAVNVDLPRRRIHRDLFWKGSFAKDSLIGWEERIRSAGLGDAAHKNGATFAAGSFWKRFDRVKDGIATGKVVNYDLELLPGDPEVRQIVYPDDNRRYFRKGDAVLLLHYRNDPYKQVYDTIKIIDDNNAIGVMHLGEFPNGIEFAAFVMSRYSYPLEKMSIEDHQMMFSQPGLAAPDPSQLQGEWNGDLIFLEHPNTALLKQVSPVLFHLSAGPDSHYRLGLPGAPGQVSWTEDLPSSSNDMRLLDKDTVIGKWTAPSLDIALMRSLRNYIEPYRDHCTFYYILERAKAGTATGTGSAAGAS